MLSRFPYGVSAGKRDQIDKKFFFEITSDLDQMTKFTSILLRNFFFKKKSIWSLFPALTPYGVSAGKSDQIDKKFFFEITNDLDQMTKFTSILLRNFFLKKKSIWSLFPALIPYNHILPSIHYMLS